MALTEEEKLLLGITTDPSGNIVQSTDSGITEEEEEDAIFNIPFGGGDEIEAEEGEDDIFNTPFGGDNITISDNVVAEGNIEKTSPSGNTTVSANVEPQMQLKLSPNSPTTIGSTGNNIIGQDDAIQPAPNMFDPNTAESGGAFTLEQKKPAFRGDYYSFGEPDPVDFAGEESFPGQLNELSPGELHGDDTELGATTTANIFGQDTSPAADFEPIDGEQEPDAIIGNLLVNEQKSREILLEDVRSVFDDPVKALAVEPLVSAALIGITATEKLFRSVGISDFELGPGAEVREEMANKGIEFVGDVIKSYGTDALKVPFKYPYQSAEFLATGGTTLLHNLGKLGVKLSKSALKKSKGFIGDLKLSRKVEGIVKKMGDKLADSSTRGATRGQLKEFTRMAKEAGRETDSFGKWAIANGLKDFSEEGILKFVDDMDAMTKHRKWEALKQWDENNGFLKSPIVEGHLIKVIDELEKRIKVMKGDKIAAYKDYLEPLRKTKELLQRNTSPNDTLLLQEKYRLSEIANSTLAKSRDDVSKMNIDIQTNVNTIASNESKVKSLLKKRADIPSDTKAQINIIQKEMDSQIIKNRRDAIVFQREMLQKRKELDELEKVLTQNQTVRNKKATKMMERSDIRREELELRIEKKENSFAKRIDAAEETGDLNRVFELVRQKDKELNPLKRELNLKQTDPDDIFEAADYADNQELSRVLKKKEKIEKELSKYQDTIRTLEDELALKKEYNEKINDVLNSDAKEEINLRLAELNTEIQGKQIENRLLSRRRRENKLSAYKRFNDEGGVERLKNIKRLQAASLNEGLTLTEVAHIQGMFDDLTNIYKKTGGDILAGIPNEGLDSMRKSLKGYMEEVFPEIKNLNSDIRLAKQAKDIADNMTVPSAMLSGADTFLGAVVGMTTGIGQAVASVAGKRIIQSPGTSGRIARLLKKNPELGAALAPTYIKKVRPVISEWIKELPKGMYERIKSKINTGKLNKQERAEFRKLLRRVSAISFFGHGIHERYEDFEREFYKRRYGVIEGSALPKELGNFRGIMSSNPEVLRYRQ
jgi:hypothetical protein